MTRLAILADIHGNLPALEAVLADLAQFAVDQVIVAGDVINWGPWSAEVMACVTAEGWPVIRGNNEYYLLDYDTPRAPPEWADARQYPMLPWLRAQLAGRWQAAIAAWPDSLSLRYAGAPAIYVCHGSPRGNTDPLFPCAPAADLAAALSGVSEPVVVAAHTHLTMERRVSGERRANGWHVLNPGSVGVPLSGDYAAHYLLLDATPAGWRATFRRVPIDPAPVLAEFERRRFLRDCGLIAHFVMAEFRNARLELHPFLRWRLAHRPTAPFTWDLLDEYARVDRRDYLPEAYRLAEG